MDISEDLLADTRDALSVCARQRFTPDLWQHAEEALRGVEAGFRKGDAKALRRALSMLEDMGEARVATRIGAKGDAPPAPVRELINRLVHDLELPSPGGGLPPGERGLSQS